MVNRWGNNGNSDRLIFLSSKITADDDCSHEVKRCLLLGRLENSTATREKPRVSNIIPRWGPCLLWRLKKRTTFRLKVRNGTLHDWSHLVCPHACINHLLFFIFLHLFLYLLFFIVLFPLQLIFNVYKYSLLPPFNFAYLFFLSLLPFLFSQSIY